MQLFGRGLYPILALKGRSTFGCLRFGSRSQILEGGGDGYHEIRRAADVETLLNITDIVARVLPIHMLDVVSRRPFASVYE